MLVFVYGTLKKGLWNHRLLEHAAFVGEAVTVETYRMQSGGVPFMLPGNGAGWQVKGEVYDVDDETLRHLDALEGYRPGYPCTYNRTEIEVLLRGNRGVRDGFIKKTRASAYIVHHNIASPYFEFRHGYIDWWPEHHSRPAVKPSLRSEHAGEQYDA